MNEEELKRLIQRTIKEELQNLMLMDRYTFQKKIQIFDGINLQLATNLGTKFGTDTDLKLAFYGLPPVNQPDTVADPSGGAIQDAGAREKISQVIDRLQELGLIA